MSLVREVIVPGGGFESKADGVLALFPSREVEGHVFEGDDVFGRIFGSDAAFVVAERHVHDPVQSVFDAPMIAHHGSEFCRRSEL